ncbi:MAG: sporulation integral membrane protein YtvI [Oscillospiraceae bacterium]
MSLVDKRKKFIINLLYFASIIGLFYLFIKYAFWPLFPLIFAFFLAVCLQKPVDKITNKFKIKKGIVSLIAVLLVMFIIATTIALLGNKIVKEFQDFINYVSIRLQDFDWIERTIRSTVEILPGFMEDAVSGTVDEFLSNLQTSMQDGATGSSALSFGSFKLSSLIFPSISGVWNTAKQIPSVLIGVIVSIISCYFMTSDYERVTKSIKLLLPKEKRFLFSRTKTILFSSLGKLAKAYGIIILITFSEVLLGLSIMSIVGVYDSSYVFVIAVITALVDVLPIFGTGTILMPWALYELLTKNTGLGIGLIVLYVVITIIRQIVEPKLVASQLDLPPVATICAMYVGLQMFGVIGMFLMPITLFCVKVLYDEGVFASYSEDKPTPVVDETLKE